jgi:putative ABC transport system permease protein
MSFIVLILKNLFRHKLRTFLTVIGISIGIATIVTLGLTVGSLTSMMAGTVRQGDFDFTIAKADSADIVLSYIKADQIDLVKSVDGVDVATGVLMIMTQVEKNPYFMIFGVEPEYNQYGGIDIVEGKMFTKENKNEAVLGKIAAKNLDKTINDTVQLNGEEYKIIGIYQTGIAMEDGGAVVLLSNAQKMQDLENTVNMMSVKVKDGYDIETVANEVENESNQELVSIIDVSDFNAADQSLKISNALTWAIGLLAIIIGGIGVMNTMIMSISERTREIGVLRALGWSRKRVILMIMGETFIIACLAIIVGSGLGILGVRVMMLSSIVSGFLEPNYFYWPIYYKAIVVSLSVAFLGGLYPALKASRLSPLEALRYE